MKNKAITYVKGLKVKQIVAVAAVVLVGILVWQYLEARAELRRFNNPAAAVDKESEDTVSEVSKIMVLPSGETPTVANISDASKLRDRAFFDNAQNGDKVLIYQDAQKAIIYRPSTKQIVEVASYQPGEEPAAE